nr:efflux RND transporter periplasmic adaptor subunit [Chiayiivirga flava]
MPPLPPLQTYTVAVAGTVSGARWDGVVEAVNAADLTAQTGGRVVAVEADVGDRVDAGAVLVRISAVEQQAGADTARAQLRAADARAAEATTNYARYLELAERQFVSRLQLDQMRATRDTAVAERDVARARLREAAQQTEYTVVRAPFAGIVGARRVEPGESVVPGQSLLSMHAPDGLRIEVQVPQSQAAAIRAAQRARIVLDDGRALDAAGVTVFPAADPATHSVAVRIAVPAMPDAPHPGTTASVEFPIPQPGAPPRIPRSATVQRGELSGVYVLADGRLTLRQLRLGHSRGDEVDVLAGLSGGETIAADPVAAMQAIAAQRAAVGSDDA